ncbi:MAG: hypothetical protein FWH04_08735 [Oscillospiraceae bacterium]|nr:hypothetical protein [Oscillospiraceae bacterium]
MADEWMMKPFDVCIAYVSWENGGKRRPILFLAKDEEYAEAFRITSQFADKSEAVKSRYLEILDWQETGLVKPSYIDTIASVEVPIANISLPPIGELTEKDKLRLLEFLAK